MTQEIDLDFTKPESDELDYRDLAYHMPLTFTVEVEGYGELTATTLLEQSHVDELINGLATGSTTTIEVPVEVTEGSVWGEEPTTEEVGCVTIDANELFDVPADSGLGDDDGGESA